MSMIEFKNVHFKYPLAEGEALKGIDFSCEESDFVVICGKSGCGKTTLLRHLKKNLTPYGKFSGSVTYEGEEISGLPDVVSATDIGFVQQNPDNQVVTDKVWHELAFGLESLGLDNQTIKRRVAEMASYFDIQTWFRKDVSELSGGQKQLLNLASVMAMQPKVLVMDEPTSQLDPIAASEFLRTVQKINRDLGTTVILSEHRLEEAFVMADKVMVMDGGKVLAYDSPRKIGKILAGSGEDDRNPMFYGLPGVMKIFESAGGEGDSPLTIREGRLWVDSEVNRKKPEGAEDKGSEAVEAGEDAAGSEAEAAVELNEAGQVTEAPGKADAAVPENEAQGEADGSGASKNGTVNTEEPAVEIKDVWFRYNKKSQDVLRDLSLTVDKGQLFCVLGGNGVGKSTTLKVISGILKQQRGKVTVNGSLAMLPQNPQALFTEISVEDEMMEALYGVSLSDEEKVDKVLAMLDTMEISHLRKSHPYDLSGGEQQRLALGKVLLLDPDIILLDEATKGLDPFFKISLARVLKKLAESGKTLFMVSHDIEFCAEYADRCAMFFDGGIVSEGTPHEFFPGNNFYTTQSNKMAREHFPEAITWEEVSGCLRQA